MLSLIHICLCPARKQRRGQDDHHKNDFELDPKGCRKGGNTGGNPDRVFPGDAVFLSVPERQGGAGILRRPSEDTEGRVEETDPRTA